VPEQTLVYVTALLHAHRREIGTRAGRRAGTARTRAKLVLRWFRDNAPIRTLAGEVALGTSTCYLYLLEAIDVIAEQPRYREPRLQRAAHRAAGDRGTRQRRTQTTLALSAANTTVPEQNRPNRRRRKRPIHPPTKKLLRKPQYPFVGQRKCRSARAKPKSRGRRSFIVRKGRAADEPEDARRGIRKSLGTANSEW
jgi:hypothetical protein